MERTQRWSCQVRREIAELYKQYLKENDIYFEASECGSLIYITFSLEESELIKMNKWIVHQPY